MFNLRLRQAETALKDGRLDEACSLAVERGIRECHKGQKLIGRLARALVERGREHLSAGAMEQAMADCEQAGRLAGNLPEVAVLRKAVGEAISLYRHERREQADAAAIAREHIENGRLTLGRQWLGRLNDGRNKNMALEEQAELRRREGETAMAAARQALERGQWDEAGESLLSVRRLYPTHPELAEMTARLGAEIRQRVRQSIEQGRLDLSESLLNKIVALAGATVETQELTIILRQGRQAYGLIESGQYRHALEHLQRLRTLLPAADWVTAAMEAARSAAEAVEALRGGPLGLLEGRAVTPETEAPEPTVVMAADAIPAPPQPTAGDVLPGRFMIHVDGGESYLVVRERSARIGPGGLSGEYDVNLMADSQLPAVTIEREEDDYFLQAGSARVRVNDAEVERKLLNDGDRLALTARCRMKFRLPNPASTSAMLELSGTRLPGTDARRVILMDRSLVLGPGVSAHLRSGQAASSTALYLRDGRLCCKADEPVMVDGRAVEPAAGLPMNTQVRIGATTFTITAV